MSEKLKADYWRGLDFYQPQNDRRGHAVIIGAGSIGSYATYCLARIGVPKITVIDFDKIEAHNLPNQFFAESMELTDAIYKVVALQSTVKMIVKDADIKIIPSRIEDININDYLPCTALFVCVDKMEVRRWIFDNNDIQNYSEFVIDARVGGLYANVFCYKPRKESEKKFYESTLHSDAEAAPLSCSGQAIADVSMAVAAEMVARYRVNASGKIYPSLHTFYDYNYGQGWIQQSNPNFGEGSALPSEIVTTDENINKVGTEPSQPKGE